MPRGRPSQYLPEYVTDAARMCSAGATMMELADYFEVTFQTVYEWRNLHPEFREAIKLGRDAADDRVENALFSRAVGFSHPDVHVTAYEGAVTLTPIVKHYAPDTNAAFIWLKNRAGWKDKTETEHTGKVTLEQLVTASQTKPDKPE